MGMAASQARLLTITARLHDVEYKAQSIQNAKIQLSTQSDQVYKEYLEALDATTLTVKDANGNTIQANYNNLFGINAVDTGKKYALRNENGHLIVDDDIKNAYEEFTKNGGKDPYQFAIWMINGDGGNSIDSIQLEQNEIDVCHAHDNDKSNKAKDIQKSIDLLLSEAGHPIGAGMDDPEYLDKYISAYNAFMDDEKVSDKDKDKLIELEDSFKAQLYKSYASEIYAKTTNTDEEKFDLDNFNKYVSIFKQIDLAGGCVSINSPEFNGPSGDASNDSDWLKKMIESGKFVIDIVSEDKNGVISFASTAPSSDSNISYTTTTSIDKSALAKAEAKYEHDSKEIDQKDKRFDMDLSKLETERTALTTEYESVKKVISENIERTFGIFS